MAYFLQGLHKNLQRLPSLALCASWAHRSRPMAASKIAVSYKESLTTRVRVPAEEIDRVIGYLAERALVLKYGKTLTGVREALEAGKGIELQDWFLSDRSLPSSTGAERDQSFERTVAVCQELDLLRQRTLTVHSYGDLLLRIADELGLRGALSEPVAGSNPFAPNPCYSTAAYFQILRYDLHFQRELLHAFADGEASFQDIARMSAEILKMVSRGIPQTVANRAPRLWLQRQIQSAQRLSTKLDKVGWSPSAEDAAIQTLYRPFEDIFLPRLEFLVDMKVIEKETPGRYTYRPGPGYQALVKLVREGRDFATTGYFEWAARAWGATCRKLEHEDDILQHLRPAHRAFKNLAGYAPIVESAVYANVSATDCDEWVIAELGDCYEALHSLARSDPPRVRINTDRFRRPATFKIEA